MGKEDSPFKGLFSHLNTERREEEREAHWACFKPSFRSLLEAVNAEVYNGDWSLEEKDDSLVLESSIEDQSTFEKDYNIISVEQGRSPWSIVVSISHKKHPYKKRANVKIIDTEEAFPLIVGGKTKLEEISQAEREELEEEIVDVFFPYLEWAIERIEVYNYLSI